MKNNKIDKQATFVSLSSRLGIAMAVSVVISVILFFVTMAVYCFAPISIAGLNVDFHNLTVSVSQDGNIDGMYYIDFDNKNEMDVSILDNVPWSATYYSNEFQTVYHIFNLEAFPALKVWTNSDSWTKSDEEYAYENTFGYSLTQVLKIIKSSNGKRIEKEKNSIVFQISEIPYMEELILAVENSVSEEMYKNNYNSISVVVVVKDNGKISEIFFTIGSEEDEDFSPYTTEERPSSAKDFCTILWDFEDIDNTEIKNAPNVKK